LTTVCGAHLARQAFAVGTDERRDLIAPGRDALLVKGAQPRLDACLDRVDQRPVEIEQQRGGLRQPAQVAQRRFR